MDTKSKETQQELFVQFSGESKKLERFPSLSKAQKPLLLTTNTEQLLMIGILFVLVLCAVFFLGVLRGKALRQPILMPARVEAIPAANTRAGETSPQAPLTKVGATPVAAQAGTLPIRAQSSSVAYLSGKPYTVQLVTHRKNEFAEAEVKTLQGAGFFSFIIPSGEYFQVCAGQYASKEEARRDLSRFSSKYKDCFLRRR